MSGEFTAEEERYNRESLLCDDFWEFHPDFFSSLSAQDREVLLKYYPQDLTNIPDVFLYRMEMLREDPDLERRARHILATVLLSVGVILPD